MVSSVTTVRIDEAYRMAQTSTISMDSNTNGNPLFGPDESRFNLFGNDGRVFARRTKTYCRNVYSKLRHSEGEVMELV